VIVVTLGRFLATVSLVVTGAALTAAPAVAARTPDTTAPTVSVWAPVTGVPVAVGEPLSAEFACAEQVVDGQQSSGLASCLGYWGLSSTPQQNLTQVSPGQALVAPQAGDYVLYAFGKDVAGNSGFAFRSWSAVAPSGTDSVDPSVVVSSPAPDAEVERGGTLLAGYSCADGGSGIASCTAPVADGQALDTSSLGTHRFSAVAIDAAGNVGREVRTYTVVEAALVTVSGTVTAEADASTQAGATLRFLRPGTDDLVAQATTDGLGGYTVQVPRGSYDVVARGPAGSHLGRTFYQRAVVDGTTLDLALPHLTVTLAMSVTRLNGAESSTVTLLRDNDTTVTSALVHGQTLSVDVPAGSYRAVVEQDGANAAAWRFKGTRAIAAEDDTTLVLTPPVHPVTVRAVDGEGDPAPGEFSFRCSTSTLDWPVLESRGLPQRPADPAAGLVVQLSDAAPASTCPVTFNPDQGPTRTEQVPTGATSYTFDPVPPGIHLTGIIHDPDGEPLTRATVTTYDGQGNPSGDASTTDGAFDVEVLPGTHSVEVTEGYGEDFWIDQLTLAPASYPAAATVDVDPVVDDVTVHVTGPGGAPAKALVYVWCKGSPLGQSRVTREWLTSASSAPVATANLHGVAVAAAPGDGCTVLARSTAGGEVQQQFTLPDGGGEVTVEVDPGVTVTGHVAVPGVTAFAPGTTVSIGSSGAAAPVAPDGTFTVANAPVGENYATVTGSAVGWSSIYVGQQVTVQDGSVLELAAEVDLLRLHVLGPSGEPGDATATLSCFGSDGTRVMGYTVTRSGPSPLDLPGFWGIPTSQASGPTCDLTVTRPGGSETTLPVQLDPDAVTTLTIAGEAGTVTPGTPSSTTDGDNVPDAVEAYAPNDGDGNHDGTPDSEQPQVTSLPSGGGVLGDGSPFLTVAVAGGGSLGAVSTLATGSVATPPPPHLTLPVGLVDFQVTGLAPGATRTVSLYPPSTAGVTGYAKYDEGSGTWSQLPADRVAVLADRVEITLTDGGIGDDDGMADGVITDPGGIVVDAFANDHTGPTISLSGPASGATYVLGAVPTPRCTATDAGSGPNGCSVVVSGGKANGVGTRTLVATATDKAGNTSTSRRSFRVVYRFAGFAQPVNASGPMSVFKKGSTVRVRFRLTDSKGRTVTSGSAPTWLTPVRGAKKPGKVNEAVSRAKPDEGSVFRSRSGFYDYRWGTAKAKPGRSYRLGVRLDDGTTYTVLVVVR